MATALDGGEKRGISRAGRMTMGASKTDESGMLGAAPQGLVRDLMVLLKLRINLLVLITTFFGFLLAAKGSGIHAGLLLATMTGTALAAFGASAFNQFIEVTPDARMRRTANRPLPAARIPRWVAMVLGWVLSLAGVALLAVLVNAAAATLTAATVIIYAGIYTPLKRVSSLNALVGAIPGALPPVIGWVAVQGHRLDGAAVFLFVLLFLWQLPHVAAVTWLYREDYEAGGYRMWSRGDASGAKCGRWAVIFSLPLVVLPLWPWLAGYTPGAPGVAALFVGIVLGLGLLAQSVAFLRNRERRSFRRLFLFTLGYLPLELGCLAIAWS